MCGIAGIRRFGPEPIREEQIRMLLLGNQRRGGQATGIAIQNPKEEIHVFKSDDIAWQFIIKDEYKDFVAQHLREDTLTVLMHTRAATKGDPQQNENNHPVYSGKTAITHNGMIHNDDTLFNNLDLKRTAEVDSDIIRAILDNYGLTMEGVRYLRRMSGSAAIAAVSNDFPGRLLLARSGNPMVLASTPHQLLWSSEKTPLHHALRPFVSRFGLYMQPQRVDVAWQTLKNDSAFVFSEEKGGLEWHDEFKIAYNYTAPNYEVHRTFKFARNKWYADAKCDIVQCPSCKDFIPLKEEQKYTPLWNLQCLRCKVPLAPMPEGVETD